MSPRQSKALMVCQKVNVLATMFVALFFLLIPAFRVVRELTDPNIRSAGVPRFAWQIHKSLTPRFTKWAAKRIATSRASELSIADISGTEWPLFGSVFYLWATDSLEDVWKSHGQSSGLAPSVYAREAIDAATRLVIDPGQANWVKKHWGTNYLKTENVFYRMLVIAALTSHARLTQDRQYLPMLKDQVDSLASEIDSSPHGCSTITLINVIPAMF